MDYKKTLLISQLVFWIGYILFYTLFEASWVGFADSLYSTLSSTLFLIAVVYTNALYFFPEYLKDRNLVKFISLSLLFLCICVLLKRVSEVYVIKNPMAPKEFFHWMGIIYSFASGVIAVVISTPIRYTFDFFRLQSEQQIIKNRQLETEMKYLKLQINPHFLFNTLNSLLYLTQKKSDDAPGVVEKLANLMRYMLEKESVTEVQIEDEIEFLNSYLELEKIRIPKVEIEFDVKQISGDMKVPPMLFLPLVENAFKHGINKSASDNFVKLKLSAEKNQIHFSVENRHLENEVTEKHKGIGLENLEKRLKLLYENRYLLTKNITNQNSYFAELKIPIHEN